MLTGTIEGVQFLRMKLPRYKTGIQAVGQGFVPVTPLPLISRPPIVGALQMRDRQAENGWGMSTKSREVIWGGRIMGAQIRAQGAGKTLLPQYNLEHCRW
jgi:hypothetical protein